MNVATQITASASRTGIDAERFLDHYAQLAEIGRTAKGGVNRQALSDSDKDAHALVLSWFDGERYSIGADAVGNIFTTRVGTEAGAASIMSGSHLDSQPTGGRYDGALGVLAAAEVLLSLDDAGLETRRPLQLVIWMNEEGARFSPVTMGSSVYAGKLALELALDATDADGNRFKDGLAGYLLDLGLSSVMAEMSSPGAYVELHIEQGPVLEREGLTVGVVSGIQGVRQYAIEVLGAEAHAGTMPLALRQDAFVTARRLIHDIEQEINTSDPRVRFTVGRCQVEPGAPNTVPGRVVFTIDIRHPDPNVLQRYGAMICGHCSYAASGTSTNLEQLIAMPPVTFDERIANAIQEAITGLGHNSISLLSGATHDAANMARVCPTGMIFVPSRDGISHREDEFTSNDEMLAGTAVLRSVMLRLANESAAPQPPR